MRRDLTLSRNIKQELSAINPADHKSAVAELAGILACRVPSYRTQGAAVVVVEPYLARRMLWLARTAAGYAHCSVTFPDGTHRQKEIRVGVSVEEDIQAGLDLSRPRLRRAYLRGAFLSRGSVSNSSSGPHLEMVFATRKDADAVCELLRRENLSPGTARRRGTWVVYLKNGDEISEFLKMLGASRGVMEYEDQRARRSLRGVVNRLVNMDGANLTRSVEASLRQIEDIQIIDEEMGLHRLPPALREIARARLEHPELTLEELGSTVTPPISKSAVNHRLRRISRLAAKLSSGPRER